jgi:capsular exopolysaccharide synthesis family protein
VRRRYKVALIAFLLLIGPALIPGLMAEPSFVAEAKVAVERPPEVLVFGADFMPNSGANNPFGGAAAELVVMKSDSVLGRAIDSLFAPLEDPGSVSGRPPEADSALGRLARRIKAALGLGSGDRGSDPALRRYKRIASLRGATELKDAGGVISISVKDRDAAGAVERANAIANAYVEYDRDKRRKASEQALSWLNQRASELRGHLLSTRETMAAIAERLGSVPPPPEEGGDEQTEALRTRLEQKRVELVAAEQQSAQLAPVGARGPASSRRVSVAEELARQEEYTKARAELERARLIFTSTHPELRRLEEVVAQLESSMPPGDSAGTLSDPLAVEKLTERNRVGASIAALRAEIHSLEVALEKRADASSKDAPEVRDYHRLRRESELEEDLLSTVQQRISATVLSAAREANTVRVLDYAIIPVVTGRQGLLLLLAGLAAAAGIAGGLAVLLELLDRRQYDSERAAADLGAPILARIPEMDPEELDPARLANEDTTGAESLRALCTALVYSGLGQEIRSLAMVSASAGEGKTTVSTTLAATIAQTGRSVVLVDADMRRPRVNAALGMTRAPGLSEVLGGRTKLADVIRSPKTLRFDVVTSGEIPDNPTTLLSNQAFVEVVEELRGIYDVTLIDSPVLLAVSDALLISARCDAALLVNRAGVADSDAFPAIAKDLKRVRARLLGVVANCVAPGDTYAYPSYLKSPYARPSGVRKRSRWGRLLRRSP